MPDGQPPAIGAVGQTEDAARPPDTWQGEGRCPKLFKLVPGAAPQVGLRTFVAKPTLALDRSDPRHERAIRTERDSNDLGASLVLNQASGLHVPGMNHALLRKTPPTAE